MYTIYVKYECLPQMRERFIQKIKNTGIMNAIRAEDGCIKYDYYLSEEDYIAQAKDDYISKTVLGEITLL